jgi:DNA-directed RNA polymerase subunit beta
LIEPPNLLEVQLASYDRFLQKDTAPGERGDFGLQGVFKSVFPIEDDIGRRKLKFLGYGFDEAEYDPGECLAKGLTYAARLKITVAFEIYDHDFWDPELGAKTLREVREEEINFGRLPLMTSQGTFIIKGVERVIVPQLNRDVGIFFSHDQGQTHPSGKILYSAKIVPLRGFRLNLELDHRDHIFARIGRKRAFPVTVLLKAMGLGARELLDYFYEAEIVRFKDNGSATRVVSSKFLIGQRAHEDVIDPLTMAIVVKKGEKFTDKTAKKLEGLAIGEIGANVEEFYGRYLASDVYDPKTNEVLLPINSEFTGEVYERLVSRGLREVRLLFTDGANVSSSFRETLELDIAQSQNDAVMEIYRKNHARPPLTLRSAQEFFDKLFFNRKHFYDLSRPGRIKLNLRLFDQDPENAADNLLTTLRPVDVLAAIKELVRLKDEKGAADDANQLGNNLVLGVGDLVANQYRVSLVSLGRSIKSSMTHREVWNLTPGVLLNCQPVVSAVMGFFAASEFSQILEQHNPLSEINHKRRLSDFGPEKLAGEYAQARSIDFHPSHYGRVCPVEKPKDHKSANIVSFATYARLNENGLVETPYRVVEKGQVTGEVRYLTAMEEAHLPMAPANTAIDANGTLTQRLVQGRLNGEAILIPPEEVRFMDVCPDQTVSVGASLIPFLEHDDPKSANQGCGFQNQAVPLLKCQAPLIGTGAERLVAIDSALTVLAHADGVVEKADATHIITRHAGKSPDGPWPVTWAGQGAGQGKASPGEGLTGEWVKFHKLKKFRKSGQNVCFNQKPIVRAGDRVKKGQVIADGPAMELGELALGRNVLVAYLPWGGYNFRDSILVSEKLIREGAFTSIQVKNFDAVVRKSNFGLEEITRDIPNINEARLANLDEAGIIRVGVYVKGGDILVGRVSPRREGQLTPEEKLIEAIFGQRISSLKDTSILVPSGIEGTVLDVKVFCHKDIDKDPRAYQIELDEIDEIIKDHEDEIRALTKVAQDRLIELLATKTAAVSVGVLKEGEVITAETIGAVSPMAFLEARVKEDQDGRLAEAVLDAVTLYQGRIDEIRLGFDKKIKKAESGDSLDPGVLKLVKVYVAMKRELQVGDKLADRHGNKGVVSRILPEEDMPFLPDGTPIDMVLNPMGVAGRLSAGQLMETHLGWAGLGLGKQIGQLVDSQNAMGLRHKFKRILGEGAYQKTLAELSDDELLKVASRSRQGLHMASAVFDGASETQIKNLLFEAGLPSSGQTTLRDGRTGAFFENEVTVGLTYMLKLNQMVDDIVHARSTGPYSMVSQQPLGYNGQLGAQRLGETQVWAMEAHGAAYSLQEFLTVKSDDVTGRARLFEKIVHGDCAHESGLPESFSVMLKQLQSLGLDVKTLEGDKP